MARVITTQGLRSLDTYAGTFQGWLNTLTCRLFSNNHVPAVADGNGAYTQATFTGYAGIALNAWGAPALDGNNNDQWTHADVTFDQTGAGTVNQIYGYYWTDGAGNVVIAEDNGVSGGVTMGGAGYSYTVSPNFYFGQLSGSP